MIRAWLGLVVLSASWLWGLSHYYEAKAKFWLVAVAAGTALLNGAVRRLPGRTAAGVSAVLLLPAAVLAPWPWRIGPVLLAAGLAVAAAGPPRVWMRRLAETALAAGSILIAQAVALVGYQAFTARVPDVPGVPARVLGAAGRLIGIDLAVDGSTVAMFSMRQVHPLACTWELLVGPAGCAMLVGGLVLVGLRAWASPGGGRREWLRPAGIFAACAIAWLPLRAAMLMALYMHRALRTGFDDPLELMGPFWSPLARMLTLVVPALLAWRLDRTPKPRPDALAEPTRPAGRTWAAAGLSLAAAAVFTGAVLWHPAGEPKGGRVLFDEARSQAPWRWKTFDTTRTDKPFDTEWYGHASGYNHYCLYDYCSRYFQTSRLKGPIDETVLRGCDVLVLKVPSADYSPEEVTAIERFVDDGGGLLLIGEHTSVWGSGVYLNRIAERFGFRFRYDCLFGMDSYFDERYDPPRTPHPIIQHMPPLEFATSCSIDPGLSAGSAVIRATGLKNLGANYFATNYYPQTENRPEMRYGAFVQVWATGRGAGRVVGFTDSTIFSNFAAFEPGKSELMLGMLDWLNRRRTVPPTGLPMAAVAVLLLGAAIWLARGRPGSWVLMLAAAALGWAATSEAVRAIHRGAMPPLTPARPMVRVTMDRTVCDAPLPKNGFIAGKDDAFGLFERSILRLGYFTRRAAGAGVTDRSNLIVLPHPNLTVTDAFRRRLVEYVEGGGQLLVLDSPANARSTANSLLHPFGLSVDRRTNLRGELAGAASWPRIPIKEAHRIRGDRSTPLAAIDGKPVAATARRGKGTVTAIGFASRFTDVNMGVTGDVVPDAELRKIYDYEFALIRAIVEDRLPASLTTRPAAGPAGGGSSSRSTDTAPAQEPASRPR